MITRTGFCVGNRLIGETSAYRLGSFLIQQKRGMEMTIDRRIDEINERLRTVESITDFTDSDIDAIKSLISDLDGIEGYADGRQGLVFLRQAIEGARKIDGLKSGRQRWRASEKVSRKFDACVKALDRHNARGDV